MLTIGTALGPNFTYDTDDIDDIERVRSVRKDNVPEQRCDAAASPTAQLYLPPQ